MTKRRKAVIGKVRKGRLANRGGGGGEGSEINENGLGENLPMYGRRLAWGEGLNIE